MKRKVGVFLIVAGLTASVAQAQFGVAWHHTPKNVVTGAEGGLRLGLVDDAVALWNKALQATGPGFRLGPVTRVVQPVPEEALLSLSRSVLGGPVASEDSSHHSPRRSCRSEQSCPLAVAVPCRDTLTASSVHEPGRLIRRFVNTPSTTRTE